MERLREGSEGCVEIEGDRGILGLGRGLVGYHIGKGVEGGHRRAGKGRALASGHLCAGFGGLKQESEARARV